MNVREIMNGIFELPLSIRDRALEEKSRILNKCLILELQGKASDDLIEIELEKMLKKYQKEVR